MQDDAGQLKQSPSRLLVTLKNIGKVLSLETGCLQGTQTASLIDWGSAGPGHHASYGPRKNPCSEMHLPGGYIFVENNKQ
jgi:hypothetical protein